MKIISVICEDCAKQIYPQRSLKKENLNGITISEGKCDICGKKSWLVPIRDYWYALTNDIKYWD